MKTIETLATTDKIPGILADLGQREQILSWWMADVTSLKNSVAEVGRLTERIGGMRLASAITRQSVEDEMNRLRRVNAEYSARFDKAVETTEENVVLKTTLEVVTRERDTFASDLATLRGSLVDRAQEQATEFHRLREVIRETGEQLKACERERDSALDRLASKAKTRKRTRARR